MRSTYRIPFKRPVIIADHWPIPFQGGICRVIEENGRANALELVFEGEPVTNSPLVEELSGPIKLNITDRDRRLTSILEQLQSAAAFLECLYDVDLGFEEIETKYEGETPEEEKRIDLKAYSMGRAEHALPLTFDMLTRALMAAEGSDGPRFEATLAHTAREALKAQRFIDSFRYSFLLIEAEFGEGQFKSDSLKRALKSSPTLNAIVQKALVEVLAPKSNHQTDTTRLLQSAPTPAQVIDHLVDKRGFYFHGNRKRKGSWRPEDQGAEEALALLAVSIAHQVSLNAASPLFAEEFVQRHFEDAMSIGAKIVFEVNFSYREPEEKFDRCGCLRINTPGTKVTAKGANDIAREFLRQFEENTPLAALQRAQCLVSETNEVVFDLTFSAAE